MLLSATSFSQEETKGAHLSQKEEFGKLENTVSQNRGSYDAIIPLQNRESNTLSKKVFGFLPYWEQSSGAHNNIQYDLLSHLACFDFLVQLDASVDTPAGWPWTTEINAAHAEGVKVLMTVVNFGGADGADAVVWELLTNTAKRDAFFVNVKNIIQAANLDGINIDFEGMTSAHRGAELNTFMSELTSYIHAELGAGYEVSIDGPSVNWGGWVIDGLVNSVDYLIVMAYDYSGSFSTETGAVSPLTHHTSWKRFVTRTIETGTYAVPTANNPEKLILAVPYYGQHWKTSTSGAEATITSYEGSTRFKNTVTEVNDAGNESFWNADFESPWYRWNDGSDWHQVWADDVLSISKKYDLAISNNLGGVGIWALNYDSTRPELWNLIDTKFNDTASIDDFLSENIKVYPNPTNQFISFSSSIELSKIGIYNVVGQKVLELNPTQNSFDLGNLSNGIYILKAVGSNGNKAAIKIIKSEFKN